MTDKATQYTEKECTECQQTWQQHPAYPCECGMCGAPGREVAAAEKALVKAMAADARASEAEEKALVKALAAEDRAWEEAGQNLSAAASDRAKRATDKVWEQVERSRKAKGEREAHARQARRNLSAAAEGTDQ